MKNKKILFLIILSLFILSVFVFLATMNSKKKPYYEISQNLEVEVYSDIKVSDFVTIHGGKLIDDYNIDTTQLRETSVEFSYVIDDKVYEDSFFIHVVDTTKPYAGVSKVYNYVIGNDFTMENDVFCGDNYTKNPECSIVGDYNLDEVGEYGLIYRVRDESGNISEYPFTLRVLEEKISTTGSRISFHDIQNRLPSDASLMIDVSKWQEDIDWKTVKESGIDYVMIRLGTQSGVGKGSVIDSYFEKNIEKAQKEGINVGVYYYSYARNEEEALEQAEWVIQVLKDYEIDLPVAFDWECWSLFSSFNINFHELNLLAKTFLTRIEEEGYNVLLYSSKNYLENVWNLDYDIWLAHYTEETNYKGPRIMWQFTSSGEIPGIHGNVDVNFYYNK